MKTLLAILLLFFGTTCFAQSTPAVPAAAPGCGTVNTKFNVQTNVSQHPFAKPEPSKALVYFLQDDSTFASRPRPTTRFGVDGSWIGATHSFSYFYVRSSQASIISVLIGSRSSLLPLV